MATKLRAVGISTIVKIAEGSDPKLGLQAAKYLADGGGSITRREKGRPSEATVVAEVKREASIEKIYLEDMERLGLEPSEKPKEPGSVLAPTPDTTQ